MSRQNLTIDRLFDRSARLPYPLRARTSPRRRWCMLTLFVILSTTIGVYWFLTDARRVRNMAEQYLGQLTGAQVSVGRATLSIFEGLRLDDVRVYAEPPTKADPGSIRSLPIFAASRFQITYDLRSMLRGKLEATRIVATNPRVVMAEDLDQGTWNYQKLAKAKTPDLPTAGPSEPLQLPDIVLRDAQIDYYEFHGGNKSLIGSMSLEGSLTAQADRYTFNLQSRGSTYQLGPNVTGTISINGGQVVAHLRNFTFGRDIKTMLPAVVRTWWEQHELAGAVDVPQLTYTPPTEDKPASFSVETELTSVSLAVHPNEWMSHDELQALQNLHDGLSLLDRVNRSLALSSGADKSIEQENLEQLEMDPIRLQKVTGMFVFTDKGIEIKHAGARIESAGSTDGSAAPLSNGFNLSGRIDGYSPDAPLSLTLSSQENENLVIPAAPRQVNSMPGPVRELYHQLKPAGECRLTVAVHRDLPGDRMIASGVIDVVNGQFQFLRFPYPVRNAKGRIEFGPDPKTGEERLALTNLQGTGVLGGPNENSTMTLNGRVAPLGPDAAVQIFIRGDHVVYEDALRRSFPPGVQNVMKLFEAPGYEGALKFEGGFLCQVFRPEGYDRDVLISTDIVLDNAGGVLKDFPYPLDHVTGLVQIRDDHVDLINIASKQNDMTLKIGGRISWKPHHEREGDDPDIIVPPQDVRGDINIDATHIAIDKKLFAALPPTQTKALTDLGLSGTLDVHGKLTQRPVPSTQPGGGTDSPMRYDLGLTMHHGGLKPAGVEWGVNGIDAELQVSPERVDVSRATGVRGNAKLSGKGSIDLTTTRPTIAANVSADNLALDQPFYNLISKDTQATWDQVRPAGSVDLDVAFNADAQHAFSMSLRPRELSAWPVNFPIKMDHLTGEVKVDDDLVTFKNLQARSGDAAVWLDGTQRLDHRDWNIKLAARGLVINDELRAAMPAAMKGMIDSISLKGKLAIDMDKLRITDAAPDATGTVPSTPDLDFAGTLWLNDSTLDLGVPISKATGRVRLASSLKSGRLTAIDGGIDAWSMQMAGREVTNFSSKLLKRPDETGLRLDDMTAEVAGGTMGGRVDLITSPDGPSRYVMNLSLRNADIAELTPESDKKIQGRLSASLSLESQWGDSAHARGRGDVIVNGEQIAKLPLLLGLFQMANLALPISGPLNDATVRYSIDGPIVTFDKIDLKGNNIRMSGDGRLDFTKKTIDMRFSTENPTAFSIPLIGPLIQSANRELLQIHVRGSVQSPKVNASTFGTISTTVDEVLNGDDGGQEKKK